VWAGRFSPDPVVVVSPVGNGRVLCCPDPAVRAVGTDLLAA
jgi:hypothetical protein